MDIVPDNWETDEDNYKDDKRFISKDAAKPGNFQQTFACPECGSHNTGQSTYADFCNTCDWGQGY